jgi:hypothetical protein
MDRILADLNASKLLWLSDLAGVCKLCKKENDEHG